MGFALFRRLDSRFGVEHGFCHATFYFRAKLVARMWLLASPCRIRIGFSRLGIIGNFVVVEVVSC